MVIAETMQTLAPGSVVAESYQVTRLLGRGGMGSVWEAEHLRLPGKRVAIKVLNTDAAADQEALARFRREAEIATRLGHPNIIEVHDFNLLPGGQPYLVLELLVGESLDVRMRRGPMSIDQIVRVAGQIAGALAAAHRAGVIHRDLKPQNVYLVPREDEVGGELVKVLDFGISKIRGSQTVKTNDSTILGTPQYMAPEQATGNHAAVDPRTDVFALGAIVYEMLAGRPAFTGENIPEVVYKVVYEAPPPLAPLARGEVPPRMIEAVERALAKKQDERFGEVAAFIEHLAGMSISTLRRQPVLPAADGEQGPADPLAATVDSARRHRASIVPPPPETAPPPPGTTLQTRPRARRAVWFALALVAAMAAAAAVAVLWTNRDGGEPAATPEPETAEDLRKRAAQAIGEEIIAAQMEGGDDEDETEGPDDGEEAAEELAAEEHEDGDQDLARSHPEPPAPPAAAPAAPKKRAAAIPPVSSLRPSAGDEPSLAAEVRSDLIAGETAFRAGDYREALYRAERAARDGAGPAAFAIMARAHCAMDNIGNAAASLRRIPSNRVVLRRAVRAFCAARGYEVDE